MTLGLGEEDANHFCGGSDRSLYPPNWSSLGRMQHLTRLHVERIGEKGCESLAFAVCRLGSLQDLSVEATYGDFFYMAHGDITVLTSPMELFLNAVFSHDNGKERHSCKLPQSLQSLTLSPSYGVMYVTILALISGFAEQVFQRLDPVWDTLSARL